MKVGRAALPLRRLGEDPSLLLPASGGLRCPLDCGSRTLISALVIHVTVSLLVRTPARLDWGPRHDLILMWLIRSPTILFPTHVTFEVLGVRMSASFFGDTIHPVTVSYLSVCTQPLAQHCQVVGAQEFVSNKSTLS